MHEIYKRYARLNVIFIVTTILLCVAAVIVFFLIPSHGAFYDYRIYLSIGMILAGILAINFIIGLLEKKIDSELYSFLGFSESGNDVRQENYPRWFAKMIEKKQSEDNK